MKDNLEPTIQSSPNISGLVSGDGNVSVDDASTNNTFDSSKFEGIDWSDSIVDWQEFAASVPEELCNSYNRQFDVVVADIDRELTHSNPILIPQGVEVRGDINADRFVRVEGTIGGSIEGTNGITVLGGTVAKAIESRNTVKICKHGHLSGPIASTGDVEVSRNAVVKSDIESRGDIEVSRNAIAEGSMDAKGNVEVSRQATVREAIEADADIEISRNATIEDSITAFGSVEISRNATVHGSIEAGSRVEISRDARVGGQINSQANVDVSRNAIVDGPIEATKEVVVSRDAIIHGSIGSEGHIAIENDGMVEGSISAERISLEQCRISGDVDGSTLDIDDSATITGTIVTESRKFAFDTDEYGQLKDE